MSRVLVYKDGAGKWRWKSVAGNGKVDGASEQGYRSKWYAKKKAVRQNPGAELEVIVFGS